MPLGSGQIILRLLGHVIDRSQACLEECRLTEHLWGLGLRITHWLCRKQIVAGRVVSALHFSCVHYHITRGVGLFGDFISETRAQGDLALVFCILNPDLLTDRREITMAARFDAVRVNSLDWKNLSDRRNFSFCLVVLLRLKMILNRD